MAPEHRPQPPTGPEVAPAPLLTMRGITKSFPGVRALDGVDLDVTAGEVHCLLGQNGGGKSTLIKLRAGVHQPDAGEIRWQGAPVTLPSPIAAMRLGVATIYQELDLVEHLSVAENVFLGHEVATGGFVRSGETTARTAELLARLGHPEIAPGALVGRLSAAQAQIVSMARALSHDVRLIVMDEPSAALDPDEVGNLFRIVAGLTAEGVAVIYISHRLEEIRRIGDRVTVLKDGRAAARGLLGSRMTLQTTWQGCDSALAAPLVLDLARLLAAAHTVGLSGPQPALGFYFKDPDGGPAALADQYTALVEYAELLRTGTPS